MKNYIFLGASSAIAIATVRILKKQTNCKILGISTKELNAIYDKSFKISSYMTEELPQIDDAVDGLVYFPGSITLKPFNRITKEEFANDLEINFLGAALSIQKYLPNLKKPEASAIVLFSSVAAQLGLPFHASISAAKSAVEGLTKSLASELAPQIRCNAIAPSLTNTPLAQKLLNTEDKIQLSKQKNPMNHVGTPDELAEATAFLLSNASSWITGQIIAVDGGMGSIRTK